MMSVLSRFMMFAKASYVVAPELLLVSNFYNRITNAAIGHL